MSSKTEIETVVARLRAMPEKALVSIGIGTKLLSRDELIEHVFKEDKIGRKIIEVQMNYLRSFKR
ncbi:MAG TPA: hypothetical protein VJB11_00175 [archaeon]|nr:hypothetical protein [archaeon]